MQRAHGFKEGNREGGGGGNTKDSHDNSRLLAQIESLKEQVKTLKAPPAERAACDTAQDEGDAEPNDDDDDDDAAAGDVENLAALQRCYDGALVQLGAEDAHTKALRARLDAARAKLRAGKPILHQVNVAQRKAARCERLLETTKTKLQELEAKRSAINDEIAAQSTKVEAAKDEVARSREELGELLEKAKAEKGAAPPSTTPPTAPNGASADAGGIHGAAAAWNVAKRAIEKQVAALPTEANAEIHNAIAAQYAAMEALLNKLPAATPVDPPPAAVPVQGSNAGESTTHTNADDDGGPGAMLDLDDVTLTRLAEILTTGGEQDATDGGTPGTDGDADENDGTGSRKSRKLMDSRATAAKQYLAGRIPLRKPQLKTGLGK